MLDGMPGRRVLVAVLCWVAVAAGAVTVGILAVTVVGREFTAGTSQPLSGNAVARAYAEANGRAGPTAGPTKASRTPRPSPTRPSESPASTRPPTGPGAPGSKVVGLSSPGGTVFARCQGDQAYLTSWSPRTGFETEEAERGPDSRTSVKFEADDREVKVIVRCSGGRPVSEIESKND